MRMWYQLAIVRINEGDRPLYHLILLGVLRIVLCAMRGFPAFTRKLREIRYPSSLWICHGIKLVIIRLLT
jgi:hypothetical protein